MLLLFGRNIKNLYSSNILSVLSVLLQNNEKEKAIYGIECTYIHLHLIYFIGNQSDIILQIKAILNTT